MYKVNFFDGKWHVVSGEGKFKANSTYSREDAIFKFANLFSNDVRYQIIHMFFKSLDGSYILKITSDALNYSNSNQCCITALLAANHWEITDYSQGTPWELALKVHCSASVDDDYDPEEPYKRGDIIII